MPIWIWILLLSLIWGYTWVVMKIGLQFMGPFTFAYYRFLIGGLAVLLYLFWKRIPFPKKAEIPWLIGIGLLQTTGMFGFVLVGMRFIGAGETSVIVYTMPIWVVILGHFFLGERLTWRKAAGVILGVAGLFSIAGWEVLVSGDRSTWIGYLCLILGSLSWGIANVMIAYRFKHADKMMVGGWQMVFGTIALYPLMWFFERDMPVILNGTSLFSLLFSALLASSFAFPLWYYILTKIEASQAAVSVLLVPFFGVLLGWLQLKEPLTPNLLIGGCFILAGIYLVSSKQRQPRLLEKRERKNETEIDLDR